MENDGSEVGQSRRAEVILQMAALILAVRTARFEDREFQGMKTPRFMAQVANSLAAAKCLYERFFRTEDKRF